MSQPGIRKAVLSVAMKNIDPENVPPSSSRQSPFFHEPKGVASFRYCKASTAGEYDAVATAPVVLFSSTTATALTVVAVVSFSGPE